MSGDAIYARVEPDPLLDDGHHNPPHEWWDHAHPGEPYPTARWPILKLAPSTHRRLHVAIDACVTAGGPDGVHTGARRHFGKVWPFAVTAWDEALAAGLTPARTL